MTDDVYGTLMHLKGRGLFECLFMSSEDLSKGLCHCWHQSPRACTGWSLSVCIRKELRSHSHLSPIDSPN